MMTDVKPVKDVMENDFENGKNKEETPGPVGEPQSDSEPKEETPTDDD